MSSRRLAAILFTDIAGYTAMMQENESVARRCRDRHREVLTQFHEEYQGQIIQYYGDGTLSIFDSGIQAVRCAIKMQQALQEAPGVPVRMGLHSGDIVQEEAGIYGDSVNLAARIESLSVPGAVMISGKLADELKNQPDLRIESLGRFAFKNVAGETEVYALDHQGLTVPQRGDLEGKLTSARSSIAVLPFVNMSSDPENEYFSDGISEEILNALAKLGTLKVTARTSSFAFKGKEIDIREIGRHLEVDTVLEGSVRKAGNRVRITAQLINIADGYHLWSETYDRDLDDIFAVQDEVTHRIVEKLKANFSEKDRQQVLFPPPTQNMRAYEYLLKARYHFNQYTPDSFTESIRFAEATLAEDPAYIEANVLLTYLYSMLGEMGLIPEEEVVEKAETCIGRILAQGGDHALIHTFAGNRILIFENQLEASKPHFQKALALNPHEPMALSMMGFYHMVREEWGEMHRYFRIGRDIDPLNTSSLELLSWGYLHRGLYKEAIQNCFEVLQMDPEHRSSLETLGLIYAFQEKYEEALHYLRQIPTEMGLRLMRSASLGFTFGRMGQVKEAQACIETILDLQATHGGERFDLNLAIVHLGLGDLESFFGSWQRGLEASAPSAILFFPFPAISALRKDPRYQELKKRFL